MIMHLLVLAVLSLYVYARPSIAENDIIALNYALALEHLENAYYTKYVPQYSQDTFDQASINASYSYFQLIQQHETAHVNALSATITSMGGTPVRPCVYTFPVTSVNLFIAIARTLENTGVSAYDGAINTIGSADLRQTAATIATVEARHAAYLNLIENITPFPDSFDTALTPIKIIGKIKPFIVSCPYDDLPLPRVVIIIDSASTPGKDLFVSVTLFCLLLTTCL